MSHPTSDIDDVVHQRTRLGILAILGEVDRAEFAYLQEALELTAGNLSRHLSTLEEAGLIKVEKGYDGKRARTWATITRQGRAALHKELDALRALVARFDQAQ